MRIDTHNHEIKQILLKIQKCILWISRSRYRDYGYPTVFNTTVPSSGESSLILSVESVLLPISGSPLGLLIQTPNCSPRSYGL